MDLSGAIISLGASALTVTRRAAGSYGADGRYDPDGSPTQVEVTALVVPATGKDLERLPEGRREDGGVLVFTKDTLRTAAVNGHQADRFDYDGDTYEVQHIDPWGDVAGYIRAVATRVGQ